MSETKITKGQLELLDIIQDFLTMKGRYPILYELCALTGRQPNHIHCTLRNLTEIGLIDYPEDLYITPTMKDILDLVSIGFTQSQIEDALSLHHITVCNVMRDLKDRGLILVEDDSADSEQGSTTFIQVTSDVYIEVRAGKSKETELINLNGCRGYLKGVTDLLECVVYYDCKPYKIDLDPFDVEQIVSYKESRHEFTRAAEADNVHHVKTYIRFHRH